MAALAFLMTAEPSKSEWLLILIIAVLLAGVQLAATRINRQ